MTTNLISDRTYCEDNSPSIRSICQTLRTQEKILVLESQVREAIKKSNLPQDDDGNYKGSHTMLTYSMSGKSDLDIIISNLDYFLKVTDIPCDN